ncbi:FAD-dependent monooxygenase [Nocardia sp. NPDC050710]|uniref:FAD-dependent monooxygenase n=1 Tax=Nocardia sp. NPDC050710 TaxID=3157220 RepID=UPI0033C3F6FC
MSQSVISRDQLLIVGAGPTGLTLAIELWSRGVQCRVIDKRPGPALTSRSFTIQPRTAEGFARSRCIDPFLAIGKQHRGMAFHFRGEDTVEYLDFGVLETPFPHILIVEQNDTEAVLREQLASLGGTIEWDTELESISTDADGRITAVLHHNNNRGSGRERIHPDWLVGCDGLNSTVRTQIGFDFEGTCYAGMRFRMMDVEVVNPYPGSEAWIDYWIDPDYMLLTTALPSAYRVLISDMNDAPRAQAQPDPGAAREAFQPVVSSWLPDAVLGVPKWCTEFDIWRRTASGYRRGRILLAGDAAHIHSPAAGMGMNTCIQDAFNLGWKLAAVATGRAPEALLDTYEEERLPIAAQVGEASHMLHLIMMAHGDSIEARLEIIRQPEFHYQAAARIAGLTYHYRDIIAQPPGLICLGGLTAGDRAPDVPITSAMSVHDLLGHFGYTLLVLQRRPGSTVAADVAEAAAPYRDLLRTAVITSPDIRATAPAGALIADDNDVHDRYGQPGDDTLCLIRPDGHLALRLPAADMDMLLTTLNATVLA